MQSEIAGAVAKQLKVALLGNNGQSAQLTTAATPSNQNVEAYNALLQGNFYYNRRTADDTRKAIGYYEEAIRLDPRYALAYAKLSVAAGTLASNYPGSVAPREVEELIATARASAKRSLELDPNLADAHSAQGVILRDIDLNFVEAEAEFRRALELAPQDASVTANFAILLSRLGRLDEAVALGQRAIALEPLRGASHANLSRLSHSARPLRRGRGGGAQGHRTAAAGRHELCAACDYSDSARQIRSGGGIREKGNRSVLAHLRTGAGPLCQRRPGGGRRGPEKTDRRKRRPAAPARSLKCMHCARNRTKCSSGWSTAGPRTTQV